MTLRRHIADTTTRTRTTLYIVTAFNVLVGSFLLTAGVLLDDRLCVFLGLLFIGGALEVAVIVRAVLRLSAPMSSVGECFEELRGRIERIESADEPTETSGSEESPMWMIDLAAIGGGDPSELAAATLDRSTFPRLVTTMEKEPPADGYGKDDLCPPTRDAAHDHASADCSPPTAPTDDGCDKDDLCRPALDASGLTTRNLLREWKLGLRNGDLAACRAVFSTLVSVADPVIVARLRLQLAELADRTEKSLREAFARRVREADYAGLLAVGERICNLLPDRPIAEEFKRVKPHLLRRVAQKNEGPTPSRRMVH